MAKVLKKIKKLQEQSETATYAHRPPKNVIRTPLSNDKAELTFASVEIAAI